LINTKYKVFGLHFFFFNFKTTKVNDFFGSRLKQLIKTSEYKTINNFAESAGVHANSISRIVSGQNNPSYDLIISCINLFPNTDMFWLLTGESSESKLAIENKMLRKRIFSLERKREAAVKALR